MGNLSLTTTQNLHQSGFSGYGSLLTVSRQLDDSFPGTFMGALMGISAVNIRTNVIPSYHMRSKGRFQSFSPGLRDGGEISAAVNWLPGPNDTQGRYAASWSLLRQATLESNDLTTVRVFAPDPDLHMWRVDGFLTQLGPFSYQPEAIMSGQVGWKIVGEPRLTTPVVWEFTGFTGWSATAANTAGNFSATTTAVAAGSKAGAASEGSAGTTIRIAGNDISVPFTGVPTISVGSAANEATVTCTITHTGLPSTALTASDAGKVKWRLYVPGGWELWGAIGTVAPNSAITMGGSSADRKGFVNAVISNGGRFYLALYGDDEKL